jgi:hypothetical protein
MFGRFGRRFGPWNRGDWEGWTPPWMQRDWEGPGGPRFFGPRGPFGQGGQWGQWGSPEFQALWSEAAEVGRLFAIASRSAFENRERLAQLRASLERTRKELTDMIYGAGQSESAESTPGTGQA